MLIPMAWRLNSSAIGWIVFAILLIPVLVFAIGVGFSDGFESDKVVNMVVAFAVIGFTSWLLRYGLSKGSVILVGVASLIVILVLVAYAAVISLLIGGLKIKVF